MDKKEMLKQAWKEVFEVEEVSDDADFFEEGGDSIKAVQLSSWLLQKGIKLDLGQIFYTPVLSQMAEILEDTDPVYVPEEMVTKELIGKKLNSIMNEENSEHQQKEEQICDPEKMSAPPEAGSDGQICDPEKMAAPAEAESDGQICDPQTMAAPAMPSTGFGAPAAPASEYNLMMSMFQAILGQQQLMLQMIQMMMQQHMNKMNPVPPAMAPMPFPPRVPTRNKKSPNRMEGQNIPDAAKKELARQMEHYRSHKVEQPIENPNVIDIKPAKVSKPQYSAGEVLDHVLSGILKEGYSRTADLFEQGLTSLDTVKMVTRCAENGYALSMQDIYMHSTYDELVKCMKPGK